MADTTSTTLPHDAAATMALQVDGGPETPAVLKARVFSTGSTGFSGNLKVDGSDGRRYQVSVNVILIGSKPQA